MLLVVVTSEGEPERRLRFHDATIRIGRSKNNEVVLVGETISRNHAKLEVVDGDVILTDLGSGIGTYLNGERVVNQVLLPGDRVTIDTHAITAQLIAADGVELDLIAAIVESRDAASRLVYADWLEGQGETERAEFLRLQESLAGANPTDANFTVRTRRLRELGGRIDIAWRFQVARQAVEGCNEARYTFKCPREWSAMLPTDLPSIRHCTICDEHVYYCATIQDARKYTARGSCVVVDIVPLRTPGDIAPPARRPIPMGGAIAMPLHAYPSNPPPPRPVEPLPPLAPPRDPADDDDLDEILPTTNEFER